MLGGRGGLWGGAAGRRAACQLPTDARRGRLSAAAAWVSQRGAAIWVCAQMGRADVRSQSGSQLGADPLTSHGCGSQIS